MDRREPPVTRDIGSGDIIRFSSARSAQRTSPTAMWSDPRGSRNSRRCSAASTYPISRLHRHHALASEIHHYYAPIWFAEETVTSALLYCSEFSGLAMRTQEAHAQNE